MRFGLPAVARAMAIAALASQAPAIAQAPAHSQAASSSQAPAASQAPASSQPPAIAQEAASAQAPAANVEELVQRASRWVTEYAERLSLVIGVEHYAQYMGDQGFSRAYRKEMVGEFALVRVNDDWLGFRDVFEVDGKPVQDRQDRLRKLFLETPEASVAQARKISAESARHNLGAIQRNFNVPTMALFFLQAGNLPRFKFRKDGEDTIDGHRVWKVRYEETRKPTIIRTSAGRDMPVKGTFWIAAAAGIVLKTHMEISSEATLTGEKQATPWDTDGGSVVRRVRSSASITVSYKEDPRLGLIVPDRMMETYEGPSINAFTGNEEVSKVNCSAIYSDFRKFETGGRLVK